MSKSAPDQLEAGDGDLRTRYAVLHLRKKLAPFQERYFTD
jgi:hypothetical protein